MAESRRKEFESEVDHPSDRVDQIVGVDTLSLLRVIKDLEEKLSVSKPSYDKPPQWAITLEKRITQLEGQLYHSQSGPGDPTNSDSSSSSRGGGGGGAEESKKAAPDIVELAAEMRLLGKVRKEIDNKINTSEINLDGKFSSVNLQLDRLHKLLQIRPTTSEVQHIMFNVNEIEKKVQSSVEGMKGEVRSILKDRLSEEMVSIIEEITNSKDSSHSLVQNIQKTVALCEAELTEMRETMEATVLQMTSELQKIVRKEEDSAHLLDDFKQEVGKHVAALNTCINDLKQVQLSEVEAVGALKLKLEDEIYKVNKSRSADRTQSEEQLQRVEQRIAKYDSLFEATSQQLEVLQSSYDVDFASVRQKQNAIDRNLVAQQVNVGRLQTVVEQFIADDYATRFVKNEEAAARVVADLTALDNKVSKFIQEDVKDMGDKILSLEDQCTAQLPQTISEVIERVDKLNESIYDVKVRIDELKQHNSEVDDNLSTLYPLNTRTDAVEGKAMELSTDLETLRESTMNSINTTDELVRRVEELEETTEGFESTISDRMNQVRDTLMDTILEAQSTNVQALRNVRDNLEIMSSNAGEDKSITASGRLRKKQRSKNSSSSMQQAAAAAGNNSLYGSGSSDDTDNNSIKFMATKGGANVDVSHLRPNDSSFDQQRGGNGGVPAGYPKVGVGNKMMIPQGRQSSQSPNQSMMGSNDMMDNESGCNNDMSMYSSYEYGFSGDGSGPTAGAAGGYRQQQQPVLQKGRNAVAILGNRAAGTIIGSHSQQVAIIGSHIEMSERNMNRLNSPALDLLEQQQQDNASSYSSQDASYRQDNASVSSMQGGSSVSSYPTTTVPPVKGRAHYNPHLQPRQQQQQQHIESFSKQDEYAHIMESTINTTAQDYPFHSQVQFMSDLCLNFEEISVKRKRVAHIPPMMCESISDVTQELAEVFAKAADYEMVQRELEHVAGLSYANSVAYDENFVLNRRSEKVEEYLLHMTQFVIGGSVAVPGMVRLDARTLFLSMTKKALDMFMSKHNQVLVVGNSRLGRIKIPSCIACDRPLLDKVRLDSIEARSGSSSSARNIHKGLEALGGGSSLVSVSVGGDSSGGSFLRGGSEHDSEIDGPAVAAAAAGPRASSLAPLGGGKKALLVGNSSNNNRGSAVLKVKPVKEPLSLPDVQS